MRKHSSIVLFTFRPDTIIDFLAQGEDSIRPFEIDPQKTGHKSREHGEGIRITISTEKPRQMLEFLKTGGPSMVPHYASVCEKEHPIFSNAQMAGWTCPHVGCGEKIVEEAYCDVHNEEIWGQTPESKKLLTETAVG